jgi:hypothetical protein
MAPADAGSPNCSLVIKLVQLVKTAWLRALVAFTATSRYILPCGRNVRAIDMLSLKCPRPVIESLPAVPHCLCAGALYAEAFRCAPALVT